MTHNINFKSAWAGIVYAMTSQKNFIVHLAIGTSTILLGMILKVGQIELLFLMLLFCLGLVVEMVNTAVESVVDLVTEEWKLHAKNAKDVAAGAMLIYALGSALIAGVILLPKIAIFIKS